MTITQNTDLTAWCCSRRTAAVALLYIAVADRYRGRFEILNYPSISTKEASMILLLYGKEVSSSNYRNRV